MLGNKVTMAAAFVAAGLAVVCQIASASAEARSAPKEDEKQLAYFKACTVRLRLEQRSNDSIVTAHGTAFGVDLTGLGLRGNSYLLTAGHNVVAPPSYDSDIRIEIGTDENGRWVACDVVAIDTELDLCLLKCNVDLPRLARLCDTDVTPGNDVVLAGSPRGIPVQAYEGKLLRRYHAGHIHSLAQVAFDHGDSGGPIFDRRSGKVAGIAVAGIPDKDDLNIRLGLYVPAPCVQSFLEDHLRKRPQDHAPLPMASESIESRSANFVPPKNQTSTNQPAAQLVRLQDAKE